MKPVFIYALLDPASLLARYVGQSCRPDGRLKGHLDGAKRNAWHSACWIRALRAKGLRPLMEILDVVPDSEADFWEREWIQNYRERGFDLTNFSVGGEGSPMQGKKHSSEANEKNRKAHLGKPSANKGREFSAEVCARMSASRLGKVPWNKGKKCPALSGKNNGNFGKPPAAETCKKISRGLQGNIPWNKGKKHPGATGNNNGNSKQRRQERGGKGAGASSNN